MASVGLIDTLQDPAAWRTLGEKAPPGEAVCALQTHRSWVFLLGATVLKMKKSVCDEVVDFSTLAQRAHFCAEELRVNSRLAPGVYRGLAAAVQAPTGFELRPVSAADAPNLLAQYPTAVEVLVHMQRLPSARMLDRLIAAGRVGASDIDRLAAVLVPFWQAAPRVTDADAYVAALQSEWRQSHAVLCSGALPPQSSPPGAKEALERLAQALIRCEPLLRQRVLHGGMREGHGDLRPEHICLPEPPAEPLVIDALEFDGRLRVGDPFDELSLLKLECTRLGAGWIGERLIERCARGLQEAPAADLLQLYAMHRAVLRARLSMQHLLDPSPRDPWRWRPLAAWYLACACHA